MEDRARLPQLVKKLEEEIRSEEAKYKSAKDDLELSQHELAREKFKCVELQNDLAAALGAESLASRAVENAEKSLENERAALRSKSEEYDRLLESRSTIRKRLGQQFLQLALNRGKRIRQPDAAKEVDMSNVKRAKTQNLDMIQEDLNESIATVAAKEENAQKHLSEALQIRKFEFREWLRNSVENIQEIIGYVEQAIGPKYPDAFARLFAETSNHSDQHPVSALWNELQRQADENYHLGEIYEVQLTELRGDTGSLEIVATEAYANHDQAILQ